MRGFSSNLPEANCDVGCSIFDVGSYDVNLLDLAMSYKNLEIWQLGRELVIDIHRMSLENLPKFELYEEGSQIRRSAKSIKSNIVEGYGRRRHKGDYLRFLEYALASCLETTDHLETLFETKSLQDQELHENLLERLDHLGRKLNRFISSVEKQHRT